MTGSPCLAAARRLAVQGTRRSRCACRRTPAGSFETLSRPDSADGTKPYL